MTQNMTAAIETRSTTKELAKSIAALPPLPATAQEILTCFGDEFIDAHKVTAVVEGDPGICARLLGLANSAYYGLSEPVNLISEAISRVLGVETVRSLVLAMAIQQSFDRKDCPVFDTEQFWTQSLLAAECCKKIAATDTAADVEIRDLAYAAGLCHNLGLMALVHLAPKATNAVLIAHREQAMPNMLAKLFVDALETDHRNMTAVLARTWSLPAPMVAAYQYLARPEPDRECRLGIVLAAAAAAVGNNLFDEELHLDLEPWALKLDIPAEDLQAMAVFGDRQQDRIQSLAKKMTR